jgi:hypothetical protein
MTATSTENHAPPAHAPDATGRRSLLNDDPIVLLLYGEEHVNLALADELALDGYEVRRASDTAKLRAVCSEWEVELVIFGRATCRGAGLDVLRKLRAGAFMPEAKRGLRTLWMTPNGDLGDVLREPTTCCAHRSHIPSFAPVCRRSCGATLPRGLA